MFAKIKGLLCRFFGMLVLNFHTPVKMQKLTHVALFLFSLLLSIAFWCFVSYNSEGESTRILYVPVQYVGLAQGVDKKASVDVVRVKVSGREKSLLGFSANALKAVVNLKGETLGTYTKDITVTSSNSDVKVYRFFPYRSNVTIYKTMKRVMPVVVNFANNVTTSRNVSNIVITPPQIVVSGKEETVRSVSELNVLVDMSKLDINGNVTLPIIIKGVTGDIVSDTDLVLSQNDVNVQVVFDDEFVSKELPLKFALVGNPQEGIVITKATLLPATIKVKAKASFFRNVKEINLGSIDVSNVSGTTDIPIQFVIPNELKKSSYEAEFDAPSVVRLNVICKRNMVKKFENVPIKLIGLNGLRWTLSSNTAVVCVEANASTFSNIKEELPFEIFVDTTDIVKKKISLPVSFKSKINGIKLLSIEPSMVTITQD